MEDERISVPALNYQAQANFIFPVAIVPDPVTGLPTLAYSTPLRWLLFNVEKVLFVDFLPSAEAAITSNPEYTCPVCQQTYFTTPSEATETTTESDHQQRVLNERPLELRCGHVIGRTCLHTILAHNERRYRHCPVCQDPIYVCRFIDTILVPTRNTWPDLLAVIRCAVRLYMLIDEASRPETHEALRSWMRSPLFGRETGLNGTRLVWMRAAFDMWDEFGEAVMWQLMRNRARRDMVRLVPTGPS